MSLTQQSNNMATTLSDTSGAVRMANSPGKLSGQIAVVTGASRGLGAAIAKRFAEEGAQVILLGRDTKAGGKVLSEIKKAGGQAQFRVLNAESETEWAKLFDHIQATYGRLDVLVNNAGIAFAPTAFDENASFEEWKQIHAVNLDSVFLGTRGAFGLMKLTSPQKLKAGGSIIQMSSGLGLTGHIGLASYCSTKGAIRNFTKATALAGAVHGIRVNSLHPGWCRTEPVVRGGTSIVDQLQANIPQGRLGSALDVANAAVFLASNDCTFMTGSELVMDGGQLAGAFKF